MSPALEQLRTTPRLFAEFALLAALEMPLDGEATPLWILLSENSCEVGGGQEAAARSRNTRALEAAWSR
jgi:hypothetical protein